MCIGFMKCVWDLWLFDLSDVFDSGVQNIRTAFLWLYTTYCGFVNEWVAISVEILLSQAYLDKDKCVG